MIRMCARCKHAPHEGRICMEPLWWGSKHDADCGCPDEVCHGEGNEWPDDSPPAEAIEVKPPRLGR